MPERKPLELAVRPDLLDAVLASMTPLEAILWLRLTLRMAMDSAALPYDLHACCELVKARSVEARRVVGELTGLGPTVALSRVTVTGDGSVTGDGLVTRDGHSRQGGAFEGSPGVGLTLASDRAWGIEPLGGAQAAERVRQRAKERKRKQREREAVTRDVTRDGHEGLVCAGNTEVLNTGIQALPSLRSASAARACEEQEPCQDRVPHPVSTPDVPEVTPERRGQALRAVKATGITGFSGMHPTLLRLLAAGVSDEELAFGCQEALARGKAFAWAMQALWGRHQDALAPQAQAAPSKPAWRLAEEARAREWMGPFAPPAV